MSVDVVALGGGILFLLTAIVGGGFTIREIALPRVPRWARAVSAVCGILLLVPFTLGIVGRGPAPDEPVAAVGGQDRRPPPAGRSGIEVDPAPATSGDHLELRGLAVSVRNDPPRAGDTLTVKYSLTNVGEEPVQLEYTFAGARDPAGNHADSEGGNENRVLGRGEAVQVEGRIFLGEPGAWRVWPCYALPGDRYCPNRWKAFVVAVR
ncbi:hypothetical protein AB0M80_37975 [Amycolatopsis sp. NPDC051045]|uniref:hypothetical protein n=1 Tax=Amycolatopsis sp. NPDC051045 TaxID=3156922 RepID=UPI00341B6018